MADKTSIDTIHGIVRAISDKLEQHVELNDDFTLATGAAGMATFYEQLRRHFQDRRWNEKAAERIVRALQSAPKHRGLRGGLWAGLAGIAWSVSYVDMEEGDRQRVLSRLDSLLERRILPLPDIGLGNVCETTFDVVEGASGVGIYLLRRLRSGAAGHVLDRILEFLIGLAGTDGQPRAFTPAELSFDDLLRERFPDGYWNCGTAHGLPGLLAVLAKAKLAGLEIAGLNEAIRSIAKWLLQNSLENQWGITWPGVVPARRSHQPPTPLDRPAWCYGSAGVVRTLWLAGQALEDDEFRQSALAGARAICCRPQHTWHLPEQIMCHGRAGVLMVMLRFFNETGQQLFADSARLLARQLCDEFDTSAENLLSGPDPNPLQKDRWGLIMGAAGTSLALLAAASEAEPEWDELFAIS